jgi:hypothetical protein
LETWVFSSIFVFVGLLVITCGLTEAELSSVFVVAGATIAGVSSIVVFKKFRNWLAHF